MANAVIKYNADIPWLVQEQQLSLQKYEMNSDLKEITVTYRRNYDDVIICKVYKVLAVPSPSNYTPVHHIPIRIFEPDTVKKRVRIEEERDYDDDDMVISEPKGRKAKDKGKIAERDPRPSKKKAKVVPEAIPTVVPAAPVYLDEEYVVEKIVDVRYRKQREFLVKWSGWSWESNTWETEEALEGTTFISDFLDELCDDNVEDLATQLARICPSLPVIDNATLAEENRKAVDYKKKVATKFNEIQKN